LSSPHREALNQRNNKKSKEKEVKQIPPEKKFPGDFFGNVLIFFSRVFELPLPRNAQKRTKKIFKKKKVRTYFFLRAGADVRRFLVLFFLPPLGISCGHIYGIVYA
jgi:hypothetical protein